MDNGDLALTERSIHLCVDMQRLFSAEGVWPTPWMPKVLPRCTALVAHCPERTIFTRFLTPQNAGQASGAWRELYARWPEATQDRLEPALLDLAPELAAFVPPAVVFDKPVYSAFAGHRLAAHLAERNIDTVILSGAETDVCVLATALGAIDHGFRVVLVIDAVCSFSDQGHDALLELFRRRFSRQAVTADNETVLRFWKA